MSQNDAVSDVLERGNFRFAKPLGILNRLDGLDGSYGQIPNSSVFGLRRFWCARVLRENSGNWTDHPCCHEATQWLKGGRLGQSNALRLRLMRHGTACTVLLVASGP